MEHIAYIMVTSERAKRHETHPVDVIQRTAYDEIVDVLQWARLLHDGPTLEGRIEWYFLNRHITQTLLAERSAEVCEKEEGQTT